MHLHQNGIVYRDLKPDNILMDESGKTRLSDLGLACRVTPNLVGAYGTRGYWAPEMLTKDARGHRVRYTQAVDWFSFGCVLYEMIIGALASPPPFSPPSSPSFVPPFVSLNFCDFTSRPPSLLPIRPPFPSQATPPSVPSGSTTGPA